MPRPPKGPRLYLRKPQGKSPYYAILDTCGYERSTGYGPDQYAEAEAEFTRYLNSKHKTTVGAQTLTALLVCDVINYYMVGKEPKAMADSRQKKDFVDLTYHIERLADFWDHKTLSDVKKSSCREYVQWRTKQPLRRATKTETPKLVTESTARRELEVLRAAIHEYHKEFTLDAVPEVTMPPKSKSRMRWLTRQEAARALLASIGWKWNAAAGKMGWIGHNWNANEGRFEEAQLTRVEKGKRRQTRTRRKHVGRFLLIGLYTGSRADAIMRARWVPSTTEPYVDVDKGLFYRRGSDERETDKRQPTVRLPPQLLRHMRRWKRLDLASGHTRVIHFDGKPVVSIRTAWEGLCNDAGLSDVVRHTLRHTSATWLMQGGMALRDAADYLGMTEETLRATYYHFHPDFQSGAGAHFTASARKQALVVNGL